MGLELGHILWGGHHPMRYREGAPARPRPSQPPGLQTEERGSCWLAPSKAMAWTPQTGGKPDTGAACPQSRDGSRSGRVGAQPARPLRLPSPVSQPALHPCPAGPRALAPAPSAWTVLAPDLHRRAPRHPRASPLPPATAPHLSPRLRASAAPISTPNPRVHVYCVSPPGLEPRESSPGPSSVSPSPPHPWRLEEHLARGRGQCLLSEGGGASAEGPSLAALVGAVAPHSPFPPVSCAGPGDLEDSQVLAPSPPFPPPPSRDGLVQVGAGCGTPGGPAAFTPAVAASSWLLGWGEWCLTWSLLVTNVHFQEHEGLRKSPPIHVQTPGLQCLVGGGWGLTSKGQRVMALLPWSSHPAGCGGQGPGSPRRHSLCLCL